MEPFEGINGSNTGDCWPVYTHNFSWTRSCVTPDALHNLTFPCPYEHWEDDKAESHLVSPATFFIQVLRLALSLCLLILILAFYNCVNVLGTNVYSTATCSLHWVLFMALVAAKALLLVVLVPVAANVDMVEESSRANQAGFIVITVVQCAVVFVLFVALDHERQFRSPDFASADSPFRHRCITPTWNRLLFSWYRVAMATVILLSLLLLIATEITFTARSSAPSSLVWVFIVSLLLPRFGILAMAVLVLRVKDGLQPTMKAKVYLVSALAFSLLEDLPSSVLNVAPNYDCHSNGACLLKELTLYDFFQAVGGVSLLFFTLFVRSQYLRVEEECKLAMVWDLQKVLQVNGRRDIVTH